MLQIENVPPFYILHPGYFQKANDEKSIMKRQRESCEVDTQKPLQDEH